MKKKKNKMYFPPYDITTSLAIRSATSTASSRPVHLTTTQTTNIDEFLRFSEYFRDKLKI